MASLLVRRVIWFMINVDKVYKITVSISSRMYKKEMLKKPIEEALYFLKSERIKANINFLEGGLNSEEHRHVDLYIDNQVDHYINSCKYLNRESSIKIRKKQRKENTFLI